MSLFHLEMVAMAAQQNNSFLSLLETLEENALI